jgi:hypothetical protein
MSAILFVMLLWVKAPDHAPQLKIAVAPVESAEVCAQYGKMFEEQTIKFQQQKEKPYTILGFSWGCDKATMQKAT